MLKLESYNVLSTFTQYKRIFHLMTGASGRTGGGWARWSSWTWWTLGLSFSGYGHYFFGFFCAAFRTAKVFFLSRREN